MRIELDREACVGHGRCYTLAPEVYEADDEGYCAGSVHDVAPEHEAQARRGARNCPEDALTIIE